MGGPPALYTLRDMFLKARLYATDRGPTEQTPIYEVAICTVGNSEH